MDLDELREQFDQAELIYTKPIDQTNKPTPGKILDEAQSLGNAKAQGVSIDDCLFVSDTTRVTLVEFMTKYPEMTPMIKNSLAWRYLVSYAITRMEQGATRKQLVPELKQLIKEATA